MCLSKFFRGETTLITDLGILLFTVGKALLIAALGSRFLHDRRELVGIVNAALNEQSIMDYGKDILALLIFAVPLGMIYLAWRTERTARWLQVALMRIPEAVYVGGATVAALCFAVSLHLLTNRSFAPVAGELPVRGYVFLGSFFAVFSLAVGRILRWWCSGLLSRAIYEQQSGE